jgi:hypothetical protein
MEQGASITSIVAPAVPDPQIALGDIDVGPFKLSALRLWPYFARLTGVIIGPQNMTADVELRVYMYESQTATTPFADVYGTTSVKAPYFRANMEIDNGIRTPFPKPPVRLEIEYYIHSPSTFGAVSAVVPT